MKYGYFLAENMVARVLPPDAVLLLRQAAVNPSPTAVDQAVDSIKLKYPEFFRVREAAVLSNPGSGRRNTIHLNTKE